MLIVFKVSELAAPVNPSIDEVTAVATARKFVEEDLLLIFLMGDSQVDSLEDITSLYVALYPVPGDYNNLG